MLSYLREQSGSWIIKIILGFIIIIFAFFFGVGGFGPKNRGPVAMVNDQAISFEEYKDSYESMVNQIRMRFGDNYNETMLEQFNVKKNALDRLIEEKLIAEAAENFKVKVLDSELADALHKFSFFKVDGKFDFDRYKNVLASNSMTPEMFEFSQKKTLTQEKVKNLLFDTIIVTDLEALQWYKLLNTQVSIDYLKFNPAEYTGINQSDEDLKNYYSGNKDKYQTDVKRKVEYLQFSSQDYKEIIKATEKELNQYYEENLRLYSVPEKVEARHILIKADETFDDDKIEEARKEAMEIYEMAIDEKNDFAELAKKYSQGPSSSNGGDLGSFAKSDMVAPFSDTAFSMEAGSISMPVKTRFGWHIIKVIAKFEPSTKPFQEVKDEIEGIIIEKKISDLAYYEAGDAFDAIVDGDSLEQAGLVTKRKVLVTEPFTKDGKGLDFQNNTQFVETAFTTTMNETSNIVEVQNSYFLIKPIQQFEPEVIEFEEVKDRVKIDLISKLQYEKAEKSANDILLLSQEGGSLAKIAKDKSLNLQTTELFSQKGTIPEIGYAPAIAEASFKLENNGEIYSQSLKMNNSFFVISLKEKFVPTDYKDTKEEIEIKTELENQKKESVYIAWIDKLKTTNDVEILIPELFE